jgi:nitroreductase
MMGSASMDTTAIDHVLSTTRAVRKRLDLDRPVERDVLLECLRLAIQAPTGSNRQDWRFVVVTDPDVRARLAAIYNESALPYLGVRADGSRAGPTNPVRDSAVYLSEVLHRVPVHVVPCVLRRPEADDPAGTASIYGSIVPAAWSFMLALRSRGLGSVWTTLHLRNERAAAELLGIPDGVSQVALIPVAYTIGDDFKPAKRPPVETVVSWDRWEATDG